MKNVYVISDNIISSLGFSTSENIQAIQKEEVGIAMVSDSRLSLNPLPLSLVDLQELNKQFTALLLAKGKNISTDSYSKLEKLFILSIYNSLSGLSVNPRNERVLLILSTTKGNIDLLEEQNKTKFNHKRLYLWELGRVIQDFHGFSNVPLIISNACISGLLAVLTASRFIRSGHYDHIVVAGGDLVSEFVISGFQSFQALSPDVCRPYDQNRNGLALGEACGTMVLSSQKPNAEGTMIEIKGGATTNDANHISGPSRTGEELSLAINNALAGSDLIYKDIDYISAHGTATPYNDEMESKAIALSHLMHVPLNSFKGYWGHTLGAAGVIESIAGMHALRENCLFRSAGYEIPGVSEPLNVICKTETASLETCLKTASGFGGCNAAIIYQKE